MIRDMTKGNIYNHIVQFSIPIILGNIFQLTYNAVDSIIVGKFAGTKALAAVGTSDPIVNMLILGISGICNYYFYLYGYYCYYCNSRSFAFKYHFEPNTDPTRNNG